MKHKCEISSTLIQVFLLPEVFPFCVSVINIPAAIYHPIKSSFLKILPSFSDHHLSFSLEIAFFQVCKFRVGSFNYPMSKIEFENAVVPEDTIIKSILDYRIHFKALRPEDTHYMAIGMNYSTAGFEIILSRKMSFYIITYYLPSGLFVVISWISFLINPEVIPGRMTMLVTLFLVLINIHNTIQTNSPKAEGFTAIKTWVIACIIFVFGAMLEYSAILLLLKLEKMECGPYAEVKTLNFRSETFQSGKLTAPATSLRCEYICILDTGLLQMFQKRSRLKGSQIHQVA